ncbi:MAG: carbohydrate kinase [Chloroflexi bacterium]|nr:carbohydrate kinase [Chloroflexota bacterium]
MIPVTEPGRTPRVLGIGELVWDMLPGGPRLGGAPFNVVAHLARFGWLAEYVTAVGRDPQGRRALDEIGRLGVGTSLVQGSDRPTGLVRVRLDAAGVPDYEIASPAAYEAIVRLDGDALEIASHADVLVFGTLAQRFVGTRKATRQVVEAAGGAVRLYDVNLRRGCWDPALLHELLGLATIVKLNDEEQATLATVLELPDSPIEAFARALAARYPVRGVCTTRGPAGAGLLLDDVYQESPAPRIDVVDTVGAGDAFAAGLAYGVVNGLPAAEILDLAIRLGALVASRPGAIPAWSLTELGTFEPPTL